MSSLWFNATVHALNMSGNFSNATFSPPDKACDILDNSVSVKIVLILVYSTIMLSSLVGNALILVILHQRKELRKTTNFFIVNMAVSDFVYPISVIPLRLAKISSSSTRWPLGSTTGFFCKVIKFLFSTSYAVSAGSLVCIAVDRFVAVVFPMKAHLVSSRFRSVVIVAIWIWAGMTNALDLYVYGLVELRNGETACTHFNNLIFSFKIYKIVRIGLFIIGPLIIITILYCVIAVTLKKQDRSLRGTSVHQKDQRKQQAIKMTVCVIASFYVCIFPSALLNALNENQMSCSIFKMLRFSSDAMLYLSSSMNPIICIIFVQSFRQGFKEIIMCWRKCFTTRRNLESRQSEEITLRDMRIIPGIGENLSSNEQELTDKCSRIV